MVGGAILAIIWILFVSLIWAPLGITLWFGVSADILTFEPGYRVASCIILLGFYSLLIFAFIKREKILRPLVFWVGILLIWFIGVLGFLHGMNEIAARFPAYKGKLASFP